VFAFDKAKLAPARPTGEEPLMRTEDGVQAELERRLRQIEDPGYHDPAHAPLPGRDIALLLAIAVVLSVAAFLIWY
jgi:hypothetical protein